MSDAIIQQSIKQVQEDMLSRIEQDVENSVGERVNELFPYLNSEDQEKLITEITSFFLKKLDDSAALAALILQLKEKIKKKIDIEKDEILNSLQNLQGEVESLKENIKNSTESNKLIIQSFSQSASVLSGSVTQIQSQINDLAKKPDIKDTKLQINLAKEEILKDFNSAKNEVIKDLANKAESAEFALLDNSIKDVNSSIAAINTDIATKTTSKGFLYSILTTIGASVVLSIIATFASASWVMNKSTENIELRVGNVETKVGDVEEKLVTAQEDLDKILIKLNSPSK